MSQITDLPSFLEAHDGDIVRVTDSITGKTYTGILAGWNDTHVSICRKRDSIDLHVERVGKITADASDTWEAVS